MANRSSRILVVGAINTDLVATMKRSPEAGETVVATSFAIHGGGKAANQAVAAARSDAAVALVGATGDDDFGSARRRDLQRDRIAVDWVLLNADAPSGVALIFVEEDGENRIAHVLGATASVGATHVMAALEAVQPELLLATNELPHEALVALLPAARAAGTTVILNATPDPASAIDLLGDVDVLIVNELEAGILLGTEVGTDVPTAIQALREQEVGTVVVTVGRDGAFADDGDGLIHRRPPAVEVVDTTGAGDTFCGTLAAELARGADLGAAVDYAVRAGALSVTRAGAQSSIPTRDEVVRFRLADA